MHYQQGPMDKAMLCIDQFSGSGTLATGSMDRTISLWDTRGGELQHHTPTILRNIP
jgi:ribosome biogenesis protein YTM1